MSVTAVGPAFALDGPLPVAPPHSLLNTQFLNADGELESVVVERDATRVLNGVVVWGYPEGCSSLWEPCSDGTFRNKSSESTMSTPRFDAFVVYKPVTCDPISLRDPEDLNRRAEAVLDATLSAAVESELAAGFFPSTNPFFGDGNVDDVTSGTAVSAKAALALLEDAIGETCRMGMIHATPGVLAAANQNPVGAAVDRLVTPSGTPVVSGMGYIGVDTPALANPGAGEQWIFATGPVRVYLGPIVTHTVKESLDRSDNDLTLRAERYVVALWDTALQAAALVDLTL